MFYFSGLLASSSASMVRNMDQMQFAEDDSSQLMYSNQQKSRQKNECQYCRKTFSRSDCLTRHMLLHTGERPYTCEICRKTFTQSGHMRQHMRTHSEIKSFKCTLCDYCTNRYLHLKSHIMCKH